MSTRILLLLLVWSLSCSAWSNEFAAQSETDSFESVHIVLKDGEDIPRSENSLRHKQEIDEILKGEDFARFEEVTRWRLIDTSETSERQEKFPEWLIRFFEFFERNSGKFDGVPKIVEILLWAALIGLIGWLIYRYRLSLGQLLGLGDNAQASKELPTSLFGIEIREEALPEDVIAEAKSIWEQSPRAALSLILRATLVKLITKYEISLHDSETENECRERISNQVPKSSSDFAGDLISTWQLMAYAHQPPSGAKFMSLCSKYSEVFDAK